MKIAILGLGNDIISDDAVGLLAARQLRQKLDGLADVIESSVSGIALMELLIGYEKAIIVDAIHTGSCSPGTIKVLQKDELDEVAAPSPHYAGLPEILALANQLQLDFPQDIEIFSIEVADPFTIGGEMSEPVLKALPDLVRTVEEQVQKWCGELMHA